MISKLKSIKESVGHKLLAGFVTLSTAPAFAAGGAGDLSALAKRGSDTFDAVNSASVTFFHLVGVVVFGLGCYLIYKDQSESGRGHAKKGVIGMLVGAALLALPTMIGMTQSTVSGGAETSGIVTTR